MADKGSTIDYRELIIQHLDEEGHKNWERVIEATYSSYYHGTEDDMSGDLLHASTKAARMAHRYALIAEYLNWIGNGHDHELALRKAQEAALQVATLLGFRW